MQKIYEIDGGCEACQLRKIGEFPTGRSISKMDRNRQEGLPASSRRTSGEAGRLCAVMAFCRILICKLAELCIIPWSRSGRNVNPWAEKCCKVNMSARNLSALHMRI